VSIGPLFLLLESIKPLFQAISVVLLLGSGVVAARVARTAGLLLLCIACFLSAVTVAGYFMIDLQLQWKITSLPMSVPRAGIFLADLLYPIEVFLWPAAVIQIAREYRGSGARAI
jgi:hypothetical protein